MNMIEELCTRGVEQVLLGFGSTDFDAPRALDGAAAHLAMTTRQVILVRVDPRGLVSVASFEQVAVARRGLARPRHRSRSRTLRGLSGSPLGGLIVLAIGVLGSALPICVACLSRAVVYRGRVDV